MLRRTALSACVLICGAIAIFTFRQGSTAPTTRKVDHPLQSRGVTFYPESLEVDPSKQGTLVGVVLDENGGKPIQNASITMWVRPSVELDEYHHLDDRIIARTDKNGRFAISGLSKAAYDLTASAAGFEPLYLERVHADGEALRLVLQDGGVSLNGRVIDLSGGVVAQARVSAMLIRDGESPPIVFESDVSSDGTFSLSTFVGTFSIVAVADGYCASARKLFMSSDTVLTIELTPAGRISGRIVVGATGATVSEAEVAIMVPPGMRGQLPKRSAQDGSFVFDNLEPGMYRVWARGDAGTSGEVRVPVGALQVSSVVLELHEGAALRGRLVDEAGLPVTGAVVKVRNANEGRDRPITTASATDGTFALASLVPGAARASFIAPGKSASIRELDLHTGTNDLGEIRLEPTVVVRGRVHLDFNQKVDGEPTVTLAWTSETGANRVRQLNIDHEMRFRFDGLPPGSGRLQALFPGVGAAEADVSRRTMAEDQDVVLSIKGQRGKWVKGSVFIEGGAAPPQKVLVTAAQNDAGGLHRVFKVTVNDRSHYRIGPFSQGAVSLKASLANAQESDAPPMVVAEFPDGGDEVDVDLHVDARKTSIGGRIVDRSGQPITDAIVLGTSGSFGPVPPTSVESKALSSHDGSFELSVLGAFPITLWVRHPEYSEYQRVLVERQDDVVLTLESGQTLAGNLKTQEGSAVTGYQVALLQEPDLSNDSVPAFGAHLLTQRIVDAGGRFEIRGLRQGFYTLRFQDGRRVLATSSVRIGNEPPPLLKVIAGTADPDGP